MIKPHRTARFYFLKFKRLRGDAASLARGVALGVFIGITPTIPLHTISIILFSFPFRASKISSLLASVVICNPLTYFPIYYFSWLIGDRFIPGILTWEKIDSIMVLINSGASFTTTITELSKLGVGALTVLLIGGCVLATPFTIVSYFMSLNFFKIIEDKRARRRVSQENK
jgi:hypothetical protein